MIVCWIEHAIGSNILSGVQDFAVEPDEQRMRKAAHLMVGSLAGSLALVTCRDPLRTSLTNRLRSLLAQGLDAAMLEQYVQVRTYSLGAHCAMHATMPQRHCSPSCMTMQVMI